MYWWVSHGDKQLLDHGTPHQSGWMTVDEALKCAKDAIARGERAVEIRGPGGEVWDEETVKNKIS